MAFSSLADNQMVTYEEATSNLPLNSGQSNPGGTEAMTKAMAFSIYNLAVTASTNSIAVNQLMQKKFGLQVAPFTGPQYVSTNDTIYISNQRYA
jgi:hypothetical protein